VFKFCYPLDLGLSSRLEEGGGDESLMMQAVMSKLYDDVTKHRGSSLSWLIAFRNAFSCKT
jgi:hypothetical protein